MDGPDGLTASTRSARGHGTSCAAPCSRTWSKGRGWGPGAHGDPPNSSALRPDLARRRDQGQRRHPARAWSRTVATTPSCSPRPVCAASSGRDAVTQRFSPRRDGPRRRPGRAGDRARRRRRGRGRCWRRSTTRPRAAPSSSSARCSPSPDSGAAGPSGCTPSRRATGRPDVSPDSSTWETGPARAYGDRSRPEAADCPLSALGIPLDRPATRDVFNRRRVAGPMRVAVTTAVDGGPGSPDCSPPPGWTPVLLPCIRFDPSPTERAWRGSVTPPAPPTGCWRPRRRALRLVWPDGMPPSPPVGRGRTGHRRRRHQAGRHGRAGG